MAKGMYNIKSESEYKKKRKLIDTYDKKSAQIMFKDKNKPRNYLTPEEQKSLPKVTNEDRSAIEVYEFMKEKPEKYTAYVDTTNKKVTTWTGQPIGNIYWIGPQYSGGFGGIRRNLRFRTPEGEEYSGVYYESSGDYANFKKLKYPQSEFVKK